MGRAPEEMSVATFADEPETPGYIGRYRIDGVIARGASGVVYRAVEEGSSEALALKTLRFVDVAELESLRREAQLLAGLEHPGIVSVRDSGVDRGVPWYVMELIEGGTMSDVLAEKPPLDRVLRLLARLCEPLAFLHGEGIVHRDLKPKNVVVRTGDWPVLVDFGLISHFEGASGREALQAGGELIGTVAYMSPEQVAADFVDARSDLYSLGCILYEAVTGEPPFAGDARGVLEQHIRAVPRRPSQLNPDLPPALNDLIQRLLAKNPRERPGYADDVARILYELNGSTDRPIEGAVRPYLYRPSFVGRDGPAKEIADALRRARAGEGSFIAVAGESGVGKTRLAMEAARLAKSRRFDVITAQCAVLDVCSRAPSEAPLAPLRPLLRAVADRCFIEGRPATDRILGRRAKVLAAYEPALSQVPGFDEQPDAPPLPPEGDRDRTLAGIAETIVQYMDGRSLLVVVDDMQWADDLTLSVLAMLRDGLIHRLPLVILGVYRTEEAHPALDRVVASPNVKLLEIARLSSQGVARIVSDMLAIDEPPWALVRSLARESEGNPFFVGEFLRGAVEAEVLRRSPLGEWYFEATDQTRELIRDGLPISSSLRDVIARRLDILDDAARRIVEAGSVIGREFSLPFASALAGISEAQQIDAAGRLLRRQILESVPGDHVRFAHDKLREVAYGGIADARKVALHRHAAEALEAVADDDARAKSSAALAHHWLIAGDKHRAIDYFGLAGRRALQGGAYADAHLHLVNALGLDDETGGLAGPTRRSHWQRMLAIASFGVGDLDASIRYGTDALIGLGERVPRTARGWGRVAIIEILRRFLGLQGGHRGSAGARPDPEAGDPAAEAALASAQLATSHFYRAQAVPTVANLLCSLNRADRAGIDSLVVESSGRLAYVAGAFGLHAMANRYFERAEGFGRRGGTPRELGMSLYLRAQYATGQGEWLRAQELAREAIDVLDDIGDRSEAEIARAIAAHSYFYSAKFTKADDLLKEILASSRDRAHEQHVAWAHFLLGRTQLALGRSSDAVPLLLEGREILVRVHDLLSVSMCEGLLSIALLQTGERARAEEIARCLLSRLETGRAAVPHSIDGYAGLLEYLFEVSMIPESRGARRDLDRAHRYLRSHARTFPLSLPLMYRTRGWKQWTAGDRLRAVRSWRRAAVAAADLGMPHERARCFEQLARYSPDAGEAERSSSIASAIRSELRGGTAADAISTAGH